MNPIIDKDGNKKWYNIEGQLHRTDGPAVECPNGNKYWYLNGKLHRTDGPAIEWARESKSWYLNGKSWYLNGKFLPEDLFLKLTGPVKRLPLYLGMGFDEFISERLKHESSYRIRQGI